MKVNELNGAFDLLSPAVEQKERMLEAILNGKKERKSNRRTYAVRYASAAIIILAVGVGIGFSVGLTEMAERQSDDSFAVLSSADSEKLPEKPEVVYGYAADSAENEKKADDDVLNSPMADMAAVTESAKFDGMKESRSLKKAAAEELSSAAGEQMSMEQIRSHEAYADVFPAYFAKGFVFDSALMKNGVLTAFFSDRAENIIKVIVSESSDKIIVEPDDILELDGEELEFAVICGDYFVEYQTCSADLHEIYKMAESSPCLK